jgi:hypothetical protein
MRQIIFQLPNSLQASNVWIPPHASYTGKAAAVFEIRSMKLKKPKNDGSEYILNKGNMKKNINSIGQLEILNYNLLKSEYFNCDNLPELMKSRKILELKHSI